MMNAKTDACALLTRLQVEEGNVCVVCAAELSSFRRFSACTDAV
jgi:hypothetical protein